MSLLEKLRLKKQKMLEQIGRGREVSEQKRAEKLRGKQNKIKNMKPGARYVISKGLMNRSKVGDVMKEYYEIRKQKREK